RRLCARGQQRLEPAHAECLQRRNRQAEAPRERHQVVVLEPVDLDQRNAFALSGRPATPHRLKPYALRYWLGVKRAEAAPVRAPARCTGAGMAEVGWNAACACGRPENALPGRDSGWLSSPITPVTRPRSRAESVQPIRQTARQPGSPGR